MIIEDLEAIPSDLTLMNYKKLKSRLYQKGGKPISRKFSPKKIKIMDEPRASSQIDI